MTPKLQLDQHEIVGDETSLSNPVDGYDKIRCDHKKQPSLREKAGEKSTGCVCLHIRAPPGAPDFNQAFAQTLFTG